MVPPQIDAILLKRFPRLGAPRDEDGSIGRLRYELDLFLPGPGAGVTDPSGLR